MSVIYGYPTNSNILATDLIIGSATNVVNGRKKNVTKNFELGSIATFYNEISAIAIAGQNNFFFQDNITQGRKSGSISFENGNGNETPFSNITTLRVSKSATSGYSIIDYINTLLNQAIIIAQTDNLNNFGIYKLNDILTIPGQPNFVDIVIEAVNGHGEIQADKFYMLAVYPGFVNPNIDDGYYVPYNGATTDVNLGEFGIQLGNVIFDNTPTNTLTAAGSMYWNNADGTVDLILKGGNVKLQIGQESVIRVVNKTATNINLLESNYQAVRVTGAQGQRLKVDLAQATTDNLSAETIGLVTETINNNQEGFITTSGLVRSINTTGSLQGENWNDGDILYLSPFTAGRITKVKPQAPNHLVIIGYVVYAHANNGSIFVKVDNGYELDELHNVKITNAVNNNVLAYTSSTEIWENKTVQTVLGYTPANVAGDTFTGNIDAPSMSLNGVNLESLMIAYAVALG